MVEHSRAPRADAARNRAQLLDAARALFAERGLDVSVGEIAKAAGVGNGTAFRHFPSKEALLNAVVEQRMGQMLEQLRASAAIEDPWDAFEDLCVEAVRAYIEDNGYMEAVKRDCAHSASIAERHGEMAEVVEGVLARAQAAGVIRPDVVIDDIPGILMAAAHGGAVPEADGGGPNAWRRILALLLDGVRIGPRSEALPERR